MSNISKITLPDGNSYDLMDKVARELLAQGISIQIVQTLPTASASTMGKFYFIPASAAATNDIYDEYVTIAAGSDPVNYSWEKIGSKQINLADYSLKSHIHNVSSTKKYLHKTNVPSTFNSANVIGSLSKKKLLKTAIQGVSGKTTASKVTMSVANETLALSLVDVDVPVADTQKLVATGEIGTGSGDNYGAEVVDGGNNTSVLTGIDQSAAVFNEINNTAASGEAVVVDAGAQTGSDTTYVAPAQ